MNDRAVRNNNPGNIRIGQPWKGLMPRSQMNKDQYNEGAFCVFMTPMWGFRAMAEIFHTYSRQGKVTIRQMISAWAPPSENDTEAYIDDVANECNLSADATFDFNDSLSMTHLCHSVSVHECGGWFFKEDDLFHGVLAAH
jgi:hypothetical protein